MNAVQHSVSRNWDGGATTAREIFLNATAQQEWVQNSPDGLRCLAHVPIWQLFCPPAATASPGSRATANRRGVLVRVPASDHQSDDGPSASPWRTPRDNRPVFCRLNKSTGSCQAVGFGPAVHHDVAPATLPGDDAGRPCGGRNRPGFSRATAIAWGHFQCVGPQRHGSVTYSVLIRRGLVNTFGILPPPYHSVVDNEVNGAR